MENIKENLLELQNAHVSYGGVRALQGANIKIDEGDVVALMGPNGAGKSTVLKALFGAAPLSEGKLLFHGRHIDPLPHEMIARGIVFIPQGRRVFPHLSVRENLEIGGVMLASRSDLKERMSHALEFFPALKAKLGQDAGTLSGGQQQMLAIARGLIVDPKVLLLDEPSLGLSPKMVNEVFDRIKDIHTKHGTTIVVVEHNIRSLLSIATRAYVLKFGKVFFEGDPKDVLSGDVLHKAFLE